jgi:hypothetical protein
MPNVFICYRRDDTNAYVGALHTALVNAFGKPNVFLDVDKIEPGVEWSPFVQETIRKADVVLVLIGPRWLSLTNPAGGVRLFDPDDHVRLEIAVGLSTRKVRLIPVLLGGAHMPRATDLPADLARLPTIHAWTLNDGLQWADGLSGLIAAVRKTKTAHEQSVQPLVVASQSTPLAGAAEPSQVEKEKTSVVETHRPSATSATASLPKPKDDAFSRIFPWWARLALSGGFGFGGLMVMNEWAGNQDLSEPMGFVTFFALVPAGWFIASRVFPFDPPSK